MPQPSTTGLGMKSFFRCSAKHGWKNLVDKFGIQIFVLIGRDNHWRWIAFGKSQAAIEWVDEGRNPTKARRRRCFYGRVVSSRLPTVFVSAAICISTLLHGVGNSANFLAVLLKFNSFCPMQNTHKHNNSLTPTVLFSSSTHSMAVCDLPKAIHLQWLSDPINTKIWIPNLSKRFFHPCFALQRKKDFIPKSVVLGCGILFENGEDLTVLSAGAMM
jgi:hypothetical protein